MCSEILAAHSKGVDMRIMNMFPRFIESGCFETVIPFSKKVIMAGGLSDLQGMWRQTGLEHGLRVVEVEGHLAHTDRLYWIGRGDP